MVGPLLKIGLRLGERLFLRHFAVDRAPPRVVIIVEKFPAAGVAGLKAPGVRSTEVCEVVLDARLIRNDAKQNCAA
jgi:hypothetical protein